MTLVGNTLTAGAALETFAKADPTVVRALIEGSLPAFGAIGLIVTALFLAAAGSSILSSRALPPWIGWAGWLAAGLTLAAAPTIFGGNSFMEVTVAGGNLSGGVYSYATSIAGVAFLLWLFIVAVSVIRDPERAGPDAAKPTWEGGREMRRKRVRFVLFAVDTLVALTATGGGIAWATGAEGDRFLVALLQGTPFKSYHVPGMILAGAVSGSAAAVAVTLRGPRSGRLASLLAGLILVGWIAGEIRLLKRPLSLGTLWEVLSFALGLIMTVVALTVRRGETRRRSWLGGG